MIKEKKHNYGLLPHLRAEAKKMNQELTTKNKTGIPF